MSDDSSQDKTEEPTDKRLDQFRDEGQIARSQEVASASSIIAILAVLSWFSQDFFKSFRRSLEGSFTFSGNELNNQIFSWFDLFALPLVKPILLSMAVLMVVSIAATGIQTGFLISGKAFIPKFRHINPVSGFTKLFSITSIIQLMKHLLKVSVIGWLIYDDIASNLDKITGLSSLSLINTGQWVMNFLGPLVVRITIFLSAVALADYLHQWYKLREQMRMTKQELKDEMKDMQLPEHVRNKVKQVARERAKMSIQKEVPHADVIITNPTHFAIAIRYQRGVDAAPRVVAKGQDLLAAAIREIAEKHKVPLYEYPELARSLYRKVKVGKYINNEFYEGVARVLAFVYQVYQKKNKPQIERNVI